LMRSKLIGVVATKEDAATAMEQPRCPTPDERLPW